MVKPGTVVWWEDSPAPVYCQRQRRPHTIAPGHRYLTWDTPGGRVIWCESCYEAAFGPLPAELPEQLRLL